MSNKSLLKTTTHAACTTLECRYNKTVQGHCLSASLDNVSSLLRESISRRTQRCDAQDICYSKMFPQLENCDHQMCANLNFQLDNFCQKIQNSIFYELPCQKNLLMDKMKNTNNLFLVKGVPSKITCGWEILGIFA